jgi:nucleoside-diphosphate-sugar epimerase
MTTTTTITMKINKNAVVIGATGYVGSAIVKGLIDHDGISSIKCTSRDVQKAQWLKDLGTNTSKVQVDVVPLQLSDNTNNKKETINELKKIMDGSDMVFFCAGYEKQSQSTIDFMVTNAVAVIEAAKATDSVNVVVLTSSGGSTNDPKLKDNTPKSEIHHFSDPDEQIKNGRYSPAAKTLMEIKSFNAIGRNHKNEIINEDIASHKSTPRLIIINPNLILGPQLDPCQEIKGNSLPWMVQILKKKTMSKYIPNDSMSIIDIRDLAKLHISAAFNENETGNGAGAASGRYFGVNKSYTWKDILTEFQTILSSNDGKYKSFEYKIPALKPNEDYENKIPTQFDHTRKDSLGVTLRPLHDTLKDLIDFFISKGAL